MTVRAARPRVVAFSTQPSVGEFLRNILEKAGFDALAIVSGRSVALEALVEMVKPDAVMYDIGFPFAPHFDELEQLRRNGRPLGRVAVVITTSDARQLKRRVGVDDALEIFRRPDDLSEIRSAVIGAIERARSGN